MKIRLPQDVETALRVLNDAGYEAYVVGGCVRDSLRGVEPHDWDITTDALPEEITRAFAGYRTIPTGLQHGTVTVLTDQRPLEITTYRVDGEYSDSRHPDHVTFTRSLREDLCRRDFTVNAMAYHPSAGLVDYFSGMADLSDGRIVCVGDPEERFAEDALRILRALRFSAVLGYSIEKNTAAAIHSLAPLLRRVSAERIAEELGRLLLGQNCKAVLLANADVLGVVLPELTPMVGLQQVNPYHYLTVYEHTAETVAAIPPVPVLRWTMLFHDCGKPQCYTRDAQGVDHFHGHAPISAALAEQALERLRLDRDTVNKVKQLVLHHDDTIGTTDPALRRLLCRLGEEGALSLIAVQRADILGQHPDKRDRLDALDAAEHRLHELIDSRDCYSLKDLRVNGNDLQSIGYSADRRLGDALMTLLEEVMDGKLPNERSALLARAAALRIT